MSSSNFVRTGGGLASAAAAMWGMVFSNPSRCQALDERFGYGLLAGEGGVHTVRSLKCRIRRGPEGRLQIHDGLLLFANEACDGEHVLVAPVRLAHLEGWVRGGSLLVE